MNRILMTGGSGLLGREILKLGFKIITPSHKEMDITDLKSVRKALDKYKPDIVLHLAAATKPPEHEKNPELGLKINILGTVNLALCCMEKKIRLVYTSSDYLYSGEGPHKENEPVKPANNFYISKLGGECAVRLCPNSLVLRLSFGPSPFPWEKVYKNQYTSKLYVNDMAPLVLFAAKSEAVGIMNLGGPRMSLENYAKETRPNIRTIIRPDWLPKDVSLDLTKMKKYIKPAKR